ncbi:MAG: hypothetical protein J6T35_02470 [Bacteroidales bacterium]|nr:hypothetical protein [Bacteroidales bacterium]
MNRIHCNYNADVMVPIEALDAITPGEFLTDDGKKCTAEFISGWNNRDGQYYEQLDHICQIKWGVPFSAVRSRWIAKYGTLEGYWYYLKLVERGT